MTFCHIILYGTVFVIPVINNNINKQKLKTMYNFKFNNPTHEFIKILDELFDESHDITSRKCPTHDVIENDDEYIVKMELPDVKKEDVNVSTENGELSVEAERIKDKKLKYVRNELYEGKYKRLFLLPDNVSTDIEAELVDGILTITIPKIIDKTKKRKKIVIN